MVPHVTGVIHTMPAPLPPEDRAEALFLHAEGLDVDATVSVMNTGRKACVMRQSLHQSSPFGPMQAWVEAHQQTVGLPSFEDQRQSEGGEEQGGQTQKVGYQNSPETGQVHLCVTNLRYTSSPLQDEEVEP